MPGSVLTAASTVMCIHGGQAIPTPTHPALLQTDVHAVAGCPFQIPFGTGTKPSPCIRIEWLGGSTQLAIGGVGVLVQSRVGICYNPEGAPQGVAIVAATQPGTSAR